jgi:2-oxo-4-hydroxy-4-carboxy-5-ureidoimidazoline decarboxylase
VTLRTLNSLPAAEARAAFARCCGARRWADAMVAARPFANRDSLAAAAAYAFDALSREDWLEAFSHHPKIGDAEALRTRFAATAAWAGREQSGAAAASEETLAALAQGNADYEGRFGYIFVVYATGMSADQMLAALRARIGNDPSRELSLAATEQRKITQLRIAKLLEEER